ncbi:MAG: glycosyltransferase family 4 protein [Gemmataceae bacterium]
MNEILVLASVFPPQIGGSGRWLYELYRRLPPSAVRIVAGCCSGCEEFDERQPMHIERQPLHLPSWGLMHPQAAWHFYQAYRRLSKIIAQNTVSCIHAGKPLPEGLLAWFLRKKTKTGYLVYVHGEELNIARSSRELAFWTQRVLTGAGAIIANSGNTRALLVHDWHLQPGRVYVVHPGVDTDYFRPAPPSRHVRHKLGWNDRPTVLTVGRLQKRKGQDMLIRALPMARQAVPDILYAIVGDGPERQQLHSLVDALHVQEHVRFHGDLTDRDLLECYQQCDLFALPNREVAGDFEGFGMVLLEAQACGKPVIAGRSGGTGEALWDGVTGLHIPCDRPEPLAHAIGQLLQDPDRRRTMGTAARTWVVERFRWPIVAGQAQEIFQSLGHLPFHGGNGLPLDCGVPGTGRTDDMASCTRPPTVP